MTLYFISGLGADKRAFGRLRLPEHYTLVHLDWLEPNDKESLRHYAERMAQGINRSEKFALIGLSFGGIVAIEMASFLQPAGTIIISSVMCRQQLPWHFRFLGNMNADALVSAAAMKKEHFFSHWFFGTKLPNEQNLFRQILQDASAGYVKWAVHQVITWKRQVPLSNVRHIHGDKDKIFPIQFTKPHRVIPGGEHFMVYTMAQDVSAVLAEELARF